MPRFLLLVLACAALAVPATALARSPLKPADMKTIRNDSLARAKVFRKTFGAKSSTVSCRKTTPYTARCDTKLFSARKSTKHNCTITTVYAVVGKSIQGKIARDGCG